MNIFNSVEGLHPRRNAFSAHTYRNDFTGSLGLNIPVYIQHVPPGTKVKISASALVRLQALIAPVMDNIDYYVHFWQIPYRLLEDDRFTKFISGEIDSEDYDSLFLTPVSFVKSKTDGLWDKIRALYADDPLESVEVYNSIVGNGSLLDFLGYDSNLFPKVEYNESDDEFVWTGGNDVKEFNWRELFAYYMLHTNWYMNENVPYFTDFVSIVDDAYKNQSLDCLTTLLVQTYYNFGYTMLPHGWEKDYFTSALPNVQFGNPVTLPIGGNAPVVPNPSASYSRMITGDSATFGSTSQSYQPQISDISRINAVYQNMLGYLDSDEDSPTGFNFTSLGTSVMFPSISFSSADMQGYGQEGVVSSFVADLSEASAITINELRFANALQKFKERQLRFGRRRLEYYKGFFDVVPEDLRLQVPKYLGGGRIPINIADIEQTSQTSGSQALGHLAGKATGIAGGFAGFTTWCSEETLIIGIAFAIPHITYANSTSRFLFKTNDIYDYFNPSFEHLGEQAIKNVEVYAGTDNPDGDFAYTPRYTEYRFHFNEMHGAFKDTLAHWTLGRIFEDTPALNADFIYMQPKNFERIFAVENEPPMLVSMLFRSRIIQPVSKYGTPMLLA